MDPQPPAKPDPSAMALLVAANLVPLGGVLFLGWQVQQVVFMYWLENIIIGGYNVLRIWALEDAGATDPGKFWLGKLALSAFFAVHYGFFCYGHGTFLASMFPGGFGMNVSRMAAHMLADPLTIACLAAMVVSHGWSFYRNCIGRGEYQASDAGMLMFRPYQRIFVTHIFIIFGGFLMMFLKSQVLPMLLFIGLKIGFDIYFHRREHGAK